MKDILLSTLNSSFQHSSFGLRYLYANVEELQPRTEILEFTIAQNPKDIAETILAKNPKILGLGVYIWNISETLHLVEILKAIAPNLIIVLGGPEVTHESEKQSIVNLANHTICGEGDFLFLEVCRDLLTGTHVPKIVSAKLPDITKIKYPYAYYTDQDIANRVIYVEASRGCPYKCEYCLSSLDKSVRNFELGSFLNEIDQLIKRGVRQFKFVDRTFNLSPSISQKILDFFLIRIDLGLFLHFEMVPDRLPDELKLLIEKFPAGSLQFEVGIQTFNPIVAKNVSRRQDYEKIQANFRYLKEKTKVHTHADLIIGLPGETIESFGQGFDTLVDYEPDEIQVGMLKRLKGFPLARHDNTFSMVFDSQPPFQVLQNKDLSFKDIQTLTFFAKAWDLVHNSGNFVNLMRDFKNFNKQKSRSNFSEFYRLSLFLQARHGQGHSIALVNLFESVWLYFSQHEIASQYPIAELLGLDYAYGKRRDLPTFLRPQVSSEFVEYIKQSNRNKSPQNQRAIPDRQMKHLSS